MGDFEKLKNIGKYLDLTNQESMIFAYKGLGFKAKDIQEKMRLSRSGYGNSASAIYEKLEITTKSKQERLKIIQRLGKAALKEYDDIIAPAVRHNAEEITLAFEKLNEERGL